MTEPTLCTLYEVASRKPGWLSKIQSICSLTDEQVNFLEWLDGEEHKMNKRLRAMEVKMRRDGFDETLIDCDSDEQRLEKLNKLIFTLTDANNELRKLDRPYVERALVLLVNRYDHWIKLRKKIRGNMIHVNGNSSILSAADIERARSVPLEEITEPVRQYILCLWHEDKSPSMWVKDGFGWCFSCGAWADSIKYRMKQNNCKFVDAVLSLKN